jgi:hypothetical protein
MSIMSPCALHRPPPCEPPSERPCRRPPTAIQCALAIVTAGLAVAAVMLALIDSASTVQAGQLPASEATLDNQGSVFAEIQPQATSDSQGSIFAEGQSPAAPYHEGSVFSEFQPQVGPYRRGSVFTAFQPQPSPTFTPFPPLPSSFGGMSTLPTKPMPVDGTWQVTCGYRCGLHTAANNATFALDIVSADRETAGQPVRSPVNGQIIAVVDSATYFCQGQWIYGPSGGSSIAIDSQDATGGAWRLRLVHLNAATISDDLRPSSAPVPVQVGTYLGDLAPLDGCAHLHMSLTRLEATQEIPQPMMINGQLLDDCGGEDCWLGTELPPQAP